MLTTTLTSVASVLHLSTSYFNATGDKTVFDATWLSAVGIILDVLLEQQQVGPTSYAFQRMVRSGHACLMNTLEPVCDPLRVAPRADSRANRLVGARSRATSCLHRHDPNVFPPQR